MNSGKTFANNRSPLIAWLFGMCFLAFATAEGQPVDQSGPIQIGGIQQYISAHGDDASNPLLLFLHGGPGGSVIGYASKFSNKLEKHFIVVHWDQRETGKTKALNLSPEPLTFELFVRDTHQVIDSLLTRFHKRKLYLVGHSWGTALGFQIARRNPELVEAWISIGTMTDQITSEQMILDKMIEKAKHDGKTEELGELRSVRIPFENGHQLYIHRKSLLAYVGTRAPFDEDYVADWANTWLSVFNEASQVNLFKTAAELHCPVYFFAGVRDYQTSSELAEKYFKVLTAPEKDLFWFTRSAHGIPSSEPDRMQNLIIEIKNRLESKLKGQSR